jgi:hypothetical protein
MILCCVSLGTEYSVLFAKLVAEALRLGLLHLALHTFSGFNRLTISCFDKSTAKNIG